jgi:hypothetical protein
MKTCFISIPVQGNRNSDAHYFAIAREIERLDIVITNECVLYPPKIDQLDSIDARLMHSSLIQKLAEADCYICDISNPSLGVGYEICKAIEFGKVVACICEAQKFAEASLMIRGISSEKFSIYSYASMDDLAAYLRSALCEQR